MKGLDTYVQITFSVFIFMSDEDNIFDFVFDSYLISGLDEEPAKCNFQIMSEIFNVPLTVHFQCTFVDAFGGSQIICHSGEACKQKSSQTDLNQVSEAANHCKNAPLKCL